MPTDDKPVTDTGAMPGGTTTVNEPAPASAPGADVSTVTPGPATTVTDPLAQMPEEQKADETMTPGAASTTDVPVVGGANPTDLPPKLPGEGEDTTNQGGVPPAATGM